MLRTARSRDADRFGSERHVEAKRANAPRGGEVRKRNHSCANARLTSGGATRTGATLPPRDPLAGTMTTRILGNARWVPVQLDQMRLAEADEAEPTQPDRRSMAADHRALMTLHRPTSIRIRQWRDRVRTLRLSPTAQRAASGSRAGGGAVPVPAPTRLPNSASHCAKCQTIFSLIGPSHCPSAARRLATRSSRSAAGMVR